MSVSTRRLWSGHILIPAAVGMFIWATLHGCARISSSEPPSPVLRGFDGNRAFALLQAQVALGPRVPGTEAHARGREWIFSELKKVTDTQEKQTFTGSINGRQMSLTNIIGVIHARAKHRQRARRILLCAHWDCRPVADCDPNLVNRTQPIPGANDGASGVAALLEVARILKAEPATWEVVVVFFDAEDSERLEDMFLGSKYFAQHMGHYRPKQAILLDMIGDANLNITRDSNSVRSNPFLYTAVLEAAKELGFEAHFTGRTMSVIDDHISLIDAGVPSIVLIDFEYPDATNRYWHTLADTPDKCSPRSLQVIGETLLRVLYNKLAE